MVFAFSPGGRGLFGLMARQENGRGGREGKGGKTSGMLLSLVYQIFVIVS